MENWWLDFFDDLYGDLILHTFNDADIKQAISFLKRKFDISKNTVIYDQCCGKGSMSIPLLEISEHIYGCDIVEHYIKELKKETQKNSFVCDDATKYLPPVKTDLTINWHTSFGYSRNDNDNLAMLQRGYDSLKENGAFILEYINFEFVVKNFKKIMTQKTNINNNEITVIRKSSFENGMLKQQWTIKEKPEWMKSGETKIYFEKELVDIFALIGFKNTTVFYDFSENSKAKNTSPKIYLIGYK